MFGRKRVLLIVPVASVALAWWGCSSSGGADGVAVQTAVNPGGDVDASRAFLALDQIKPIPAAPVRPAELQPLSERASRQLARATQLVEEQRFTEAAIELERALRYDPNHPEIHRTLAQLHWEAGNFERARSHAERALEGNRDDAVAHYILGRCRLIGKDTVAAMQSFRTAMQCSDYDANREAAALTHFFLARALDSEGYLTAALDQYAAFKRTAGGLASPWRDPDLIELLRPGGEPAARERASLLERLGRFAEAADALAPAVAATPKDVELGLRHARLLLRANRFEDALRAARTLPAEDAQALALLFEIHEASGHPERMADELRARLAKRPDDADIVLQLAGVLTRLEKPDEALTVLRAFLADHTDAENVRSRLLEVLLGRRQWSEGLRMAAEGVERDPFQAQAYANRLVQRAANDEAATAITRDAQAVGSWSTYYLAGAVAAGAGRLGEAETAYRASLEKRADFMPARTALARLLLDAFRYDEALTVAGRRDAETPESAELELVLGEVYDRLDNVEKADLHFRAALQMDRSDPRAMLAIARLYDHAGRRLQAQRQLRVVLERFPDHDLAREMLLESYLQDGQFDAAIEQIEELRRRAGSELLKARCDALLTHVIRDQNVEAYREALRDAMKSHGEDAASWLSIADSYGPDGDPQKKAEAYRNSLALDPGEEAAAVGLVDSARRLLNFEESVSLLETLLERRPNRMRWRLAYIDLLQILHRYEDALAAARYALEQDSTSKEDRLRYERATIDTLRLAGRGDEALTQLEALAAARADEREWQLLLAEEYLRQDKADQAVPILERIHAEQNEWRTLLTFANALQAAKQYDRALQYLLDWLGRDPENDATLAALAQVLTSAKRYDEALELIRDRQLHTLQRQAFQNEEIRTFLLAGRFDDAIEVIDVLLDEATVILRATHEAGGRIRAGAVTLRPVHRLPDEPFTLEDVHRRIVDLRLRRADALIRDKDPGTAQRELNDWLEDARDPQERFFYLGYLGQTFRAQQKETEATEVLSRALLLQPKNEGLNNDVAYGWIDQGVKLDEAETMIRFALAEQPRNAAFLDTYGWLQYKKGDFAAAEKWLARAKLALRDEDPVIADHLGDTLWRLGRKEEAIRAWEEAVATVAARSDDATPSADVERVRASTPKKIEEARSNAEPAVAPLALPAPKPGEPADPKPPPDHTDRAE